MMLWMLLQGLYEPHTHFCPVFHAKTFPVFGKKWKLDYHR